MNLLWRLGKEASKYKRLYLVAIVSTFLLTIINLIAPKLLSNMTAIVEQKTALDPVREIGILTGILITLRLLKILIRYLSNYLSHKAA